MTITVADLRNPPQAAANDLGRIATGFVVIYLIYFGSAFVFAAIDPTLSALIRTLLTLAGVVAVEAGLFKRSVGAAISQLGLGRPPLRALAAAALVGAPLAVFFPVFSAMTGTAFTLPDGWLWTYLGYAAVSGLTEEVMFRAYLFGHLRAGRSFWRAGLLTMLCFSAVHLLLLLRLNVVVALAAILLAAAASFPMAYLYDHSRQSIWPAALLHSLAHLISVVSVAGGALAAPLAFMALAALSPWLLFALGPRYFSGGR